MRGFYSIRPKFIDAIRRPAADHVAVDPYETNPGFTARHTESVTQYASGMVRVDLGEPIGGKVVKRPAVPAAEPEPAPEPLPAPTPPDPRTKQQRAITRDA